MHSFAFYFSRFLGSFSLLIYFFLSSFDILPSSSSEVGYLFVSYPQTTGPSGPLLCDGHVESSAAAALRSSFRYIVSPCSLFVGHYYDNRTKKVLPLSIVLYFSLPLFHPKSVPSLIPSGLRSCWESCPEEYPARLIKPCGKFRSWNPVSCLHSTDSSGRLRCTTPYYCTVSLRNRGTCAIVCPTTPSRVRVARLG